ncbi:MAG: DUF3179 domain-containing (seleno)protein [Actinomycetota bacterium]
MSRRALVVAMVAIAAVAAVVFGIVGDGSDEDETVLPVSDGPPPTNPPLPPAPISPTGPVSEEVRAALDSLVSDPLGVRLTEFETLGASGDPRIAWQLVDHMRVTIGFPGETFSSNAVADLLGLSRIEARLLRDPDADPDAVGLAWADWTDLLLAWDVPTTQDYVDDKRELLAQVDPGFAVFVTDDDALDWRRVTWGGVERDGIPTLVDPIVTAAEEAAWLPDDEMILGLVVDGEARAYPQRHLDVHEIAEDTLGDRRVHVTLCTLCGSAVAFDTTDVPGVGPLRLRTSGLLESSNKLMFDPETESLLRQFSGDAVTGELLDAGIELPILALTVTSWSDWREAHPDTTVLAEDPGTGRGYTPGVLEARDGDGPIFPVGDIDGRLPSNLDVLGVDGPEGPVAFEPEALDAVLADGPVLVAGIRIDAADGRPRFMTVDGDELTPLSTRWFAWAQRSPDTAIWPAEAAAS